MNAREAAFKILLDIYNNGAYANIALGRFLKKNKLADKDRRFVTELVYGTVKAGDTLLWILRQYIKMPLKKIHPMIKIILRMGIYQLLYMDKVPVSAACNESVKLAKKHGHTGTVKFVNAVLRTLSRDESKGDFNKVSNDKSLYIALKYWHPEWMVKLFIKKLGVEETIKLCQFNNTNAPLSLRCNTLKIAPNELVNVLEKNGVICHKSNICDEGIICDDHPALSKIGALSDGSAIVQDESSMLVAHVVAPSPHDMVIDMCSAPGGKTTHIATLMGNKGRVIANDIYEHKIKLITENVVKLGLTNIEYSLSDARLLGEKYKGQADRVLADVPCSGLGVLRRKVDARWNKSREELKKLPQLQYEILQSAAMTVKKGGILVYSTCTINREENNDVVNKFLQKNPEFILDNIDQFLPAGLTSDNNMLQLMPHINNTDGFFIARLKKK
ncbi:16S rRNA (cytosine(967)-C(5))-methyltransferase RsmB [Pectinatus sottacetonis]|uniref:16S rRNA (cytosine(967)-C(5))-methyltransferase RsmB n=1 Tax=Pectinatus sottacetonis TaxID=1002795 RepID=UPI0018C79D38|nr:16S rRNA (cytosine(967)-C(5))-methyltransferase RsmB [Pectinatus sottacetonis]